MSAMGRPSARLLIWLNLNRLKVRQPDQFLVWVLRLAVPASRDVFDARSASDFKRLFAIWMWAEPCRSEICL
jgi:hypothetical protein